MRRPGFTLAAATVILVAIALALTLGDRSGPAETARVRLLPDLEGRLDMVDEIAIATAKASIDIKRDGEAWTLVSNGGLPAKSAPVAKFLIGIARLEKIEAKTADPAFYDRLGLGDDADTVRLAAGDDTVLIHVGKAAPGGQDRRFVRLDDQAATWIAGPMPDISGPVRDWIGLALPSLPRSRVARVVIRHGDGDQIAVARATPGDDIFTIEALAKGEQPAYDRVADGLAGGLNYLSYDDVRPAADIDFKDATAVTYATWDGLTVEALIAKVADAWWMKVGASYDAGVAAGAEAPKAMPDASADGAKEAADIAALGPWAFRLPDYRVTELVKRRADFMKKAEDDRHD